MIINVTAGDPLEKIKPTLQVAPVGPSYTDHVEDEENEEREYRVRVTRRVDILEECYVYVEASSAEEAEERVNDDIYGHCDQWEYVDTFDSYDEEVQEVEEI